MINLTNEAYGAMAAKASPKSPSKRTIPLAFLVGGAICALGQAILNIYRHFGASDDLAYPATSCTLIFLAALLTGLNIYDKIAKLGGAGTLVPITGFANAITSPALEFKSEGYVLGLGAKMFIIAGPVLVYGLSAGVAYGLILFLFGLY